MDKMTEDALPTEIQRQMQREVELLNLDLRGVGLSPLWQVTAEITPDGFIRRLYTTPVPARESVSSDE